MIHWGWGFHHVRGDINPGDRRVRSCRSLICVEGFVLRGWDLIFPRWRWLFELQRFSGQWLARGLEFPHLAQRYRPGGSPFSSPVCWICRCMVGLMILGGDLILPGWH